MHRWQRWAILPSMGAALKLYDETPTGERVHEFTLQLVSDRVTVRELIEARVREEVRSYNAQKPKLFRGLIQPTDTEMQLNGFRLRKQRDIDADKQCVAAMKAFESNGFFMLVDDKQVESLDADLFLTPNTTVSFVKLVALVGG